MKGYLVSRLSEKSTWYAILLLVSTFGLADFLPEQKEAIVNLAVILCGGAAIVTPERMRDGRNDQGKRK